MAEEKNTNIVALQEKDVQLVVSKETIGQLTTNIKEVKARVEKVLPMYDISNYSTDDIPKCKEDKALLNKAAKALDDKRKELEKVWNKPFEEFKTTCNDTCKLIKNAVSLIDGVIKEDENRTKKAKREEIEKLAEKCGVETIGIKLDLIFDAKWLNKTTSMKSIEKAITEKVDNIKKDLETLKLFAEDYDALAARYKENLNLQETIAWGGRRKSRRTMQPSNRKSSRRMVRCLLMKKMPWMLSLPLWDSRLHLLLQPRHVLTFVPVQKRLWNVWNASCVTMVSLLMFSKNGISD